MPGRGQSPTPSKPVPNEELRKPKSPVSEVENVSFSHVKDLVRRISAVTSPDEIEVTNLAAELKTRITEENDLIDLVDQLCDKALSDHEIGPVVGALCGQAAHHHAGEMKLKNLLLQKVQNQFAERESVESTDRKRFVNSAMFLGEILFYIKSDKGSQFKVLATPVLTYLSMLLKPHLSADPGPDIDEEMVVVAKQLLQNGRILHEVSPPGVEECVRGISEVLVRHSLLPQTRLNLLAALGELWPNVNKDLNTRTLHAALAAKLGFSLKV